jgi:outer membrane receptor protein involved in Fe transport
VSFIESGTPNYEAGVAVGIPLVEDKLALRASAWYRHDGGWVDRVGPLTASGYNPEKIEKNINQQDSKAFKVDLLWQPTPELSIVPSFYYQRTDAQDIGQIYRNTSNPSKLDYNTPSQLKLPSEQWFTLSSLAVELDLGGVELISNTSYFRASLDQMFDYTYQSAELNSSLVPYITIPGENESAVHADTQRTFTQEVRLQSRPGGRLNWVLGGFYYRSKQASGQDIISPYIDRLIQNSSGGAANLVSVFGAPLLAGDVFYRGVTTAVDEQLAVFGQVDFNLTEKLKLTAGIRASRTTYRADILGDGPLNGGYELINVNQKEHPITPKFGVSYQVDPELMLYASAAKGFRPGASQPQNNSIRCAPDFAALGMASSPTSYASDSLWSYEVGAKKRVGRKINLETSAYLIKWDNIQQRVVLPSCGSAFIVNLGTVTSKGLDFTVNAKVTDNLTISSAIGVNQVQFDETIYSVPPRIVRTKGSELPAIPFSFTVSAQYDFALTNRADGYFRLDYQRSDSPSIGLPTDFGFDRLNDPLPEINNLDLRLGASLSGLDVSLFAANVLNNKPLQYFHAAANSVLFRAQAPRPRTIGLNVTYRY